MNQVVEYQNPFSNAVSVTAPRGGAVTSAASAETQRAIAEVQASIMLAKQFPRDRVKSYEEIMTECCRENLAAVAIYSYARGGTEVTGPSIRLAEAIRVAWGNLQSGWRELSRRPGESEVEAWAWDAEKNTRESITFIIKHMRDTKQGQKPLTAERDIYELCANQAKRRQRACILSLIPGDVVDMAVKQCETTLATKVQITPERITNMVQMFAGHGVTKEMIEKRIQRRVDSINGPLMMTLTKIYNSLKDGMSSPSEWFEADEKPSDSAPASGNQGVKDKLKGKQAAAEAPEPAKAEATPMDVPMLELKGKEILKALQDNPDAVYRKGLIDTNADLLRQVYEAGLTELAGEIAGMKPAEGGQ